MNCFLGMPQGYKGQGGKELLKVESSADIAINAYIEEKEVPNREMRIRIF